MKFLLLLLLGAYLLPAPALADTNQQIAQKIIQESINDYSGNCPCPYNRDRAGRSCGKRSAYSRPGGESPLCYEDDVSEEMIEAYRQRQQR